MIFIGASMALFFNSVNFLKPVGLGKMLNLQLGAEEFDKETLTFCARTSSGPAERFSPQNTVA